MVDELKGILSSVEQFLGGGGDPGFIRNSILNALPAEQTPAQPEEKVTSLKQPILPDTPSINSGDMIEESDIDAIPDSIPDLSGYKRWDAIDNMNYETAFQHMLKGGLTLTRTKGQALSMYLEALKKHENSGNEGLTTIGGQKRFMMFQSLPEKREKGQSEYEIGYGIKVMDDWLGDDPNKWLKIHGVPVDVREGLTPDQVNTIMMDRLMKDQAVTSTQLQHWDKMTEEERVGWQDLVYNGGIGLLKSPSQAKSAADKGHTLEGLVKLSHFTRAGKDHYRGLLTRRLNMYNKAALSVSGAPVIEKYQWGENGIQIKFSSKLVSDKFSNKFKKEVNDNGGWYSVPGNVTGKTMEYSANDDYEF